MKIYECKICKFKGLRQTVREHIKKTHNWKAKKSLSKQMRSYETDEEGKEIKVKVKKWKW